MIQLWETLGQSVWQKLACARSLCQCLERLWVVRWRGGGSWHYSAWLMALGQLGGSHCCPYHHQPNAIDARLSLQRSARSWQSSSNAWSSSLSRGCSCYRTSRSSSAGKQRLSWSTPAAWRSWLSGSPPRSAAPGSTSSSEKGLVVWAMGSSGAGS